MKNNKSFLQMKFTTLAIIFFLTFNTTYFQIKVPSINELAGTTWKDYKCTANKENYKFTGSDILTFYSFKRDSSVTTWTIDKTRKDL